MKAEIVRKAERLLGLLDGIDDIAEYNTPHYEHSHLKLRISIYDGDEDGGETHADVLLPLSMLDLILPELRGDVCAKLRHMGVSLPEETNG